MRKTVSAALITGFLLSVSSQFVVAESLEDRLERLEKLLSSQVLMEQMQHMEQIRLELSELRELVENQEHQLDQIKQRQRNLYQDMDRRLHNLEAGSTSKGAGSRTSAPIAPPSHVPNPSNVAAPVVATAPQAVAANPSDKDGKLSYRQAFNVLKEGRYQQAIIDFRNFMLNHPDSKFIANAQYWLAEANYVSRDYKTALNEFEKVLKNFPESQKVRDADLKIGFTYYEMQNWSAARTALNSVVARYPNAAVARKADERLQRMKREGR